MARNNRASRANRAILQAQAAAWPQPQPEDRWSQPTEAHGGVAPMFRSVTDSNGVTWSDNAHPEQEYEHHDRQPARFGAYKAPMSSQVRNQVFNQAAQRVGAMTFQSVLRDADPGEVNSAELIPHCYDEGGE